MVDKHTILEGKVHVYRRDDGPVWQCSAYVAGKNRRVSTKESSLSAAKQVAEDWYFGLRDKEQRGEVLSEPSFKDAAERFTQEYETMTNGERNAEWVQCHFRRIRLYLTPFFGAHGLSKITASLAQDYRLQRMQSPVVAATDEAIVKPWRMPARSKLHHEMVTLCLTLKRLRCGMAGSTTCLIGQFPTGFAQGSASRLVLTGRI